MERARLGARILLIGISALEIALVTRDPTIVVNSVFTLTPGVAGFLEWIFDALEATASRLKSVANSDALARLFGALFHFVSQLDTCRNEKARRTIVPTRRCFISASVQLADETVTHAIYHRRL